MFNCKNDLFLKDMEIQWNDHFHMRNQTWKTLQFALLVFLGVIALEFKSGIQGWIINIGYFAVVLTSLLGLFVTLHHRDGQKMKFELIKMYEKKLGLWTYVGPIVEKYDKRCLSKMETSIYILIAHSILILLAAAILIFKVSGNRPAS